MKKVTIFPSIIYMLFLLWELDAQSEYPEAMVGISHASVSYTHLTLPTSDLV